MPHSELFHAASRALETVVLPPRGRRAHRVAALGTLTVTNKEPLVQQTITIHIDDLDGRHIRQGSGGTVSFSLDGIDYEIDLSARHRRELEKALDPYIAAGRKLPRRARTRR
jgi:Lsr2